MARIQILPLPPQKLGDVEHTPFILILDQVGEEEAPTAAELDSLKVYSGAVTVLVNMGILDAPGSLDLTEEQRAQLTQWLLTPRQSVTNSTNTDTHPLDDPAARDQVTDTRLTDQPHTEPHTVT